MENRFYVYALLDPSKNDQPFYIGKGVKDRVKHHYYPTYLDKCSNKHKSNTIRHYRSLGYLDKYIFVKEHLSKQEALNFECELIAKYGRVNDGGILCNLTSGGEGGTLGSDHHCHKMIENGSHIFQGETNPIKVLALQGKHPSTLAKGKSHWANGVNNPNAQARPWNNSRATSRSKSVWKFADKLFTIYLQHLKFSAKILADFNTENNTDVNMKDIKHIVKHFKSGWIPSVDTEWLIFKN